MSVTLLQMRTKVRDWLATSSTRLPDSNLTDIINIAQREIFRTRDLRFGEFHGTPSFTNGTPTVAIPVVGAGGADFLRPIIWWYTTLTNPAAITILSEISFDEYREKYQNSASPTGEPIEFAIFNASLYLGPIPDRTVVTQLDFYGVPADLSADADHNDLTDFGWEALLFKSLSMASQFMLEDDRGLYFERMANKYLDQLSHDHGRSRHTARRFAQAVEPH